MSEPGNKRDIGVNDQDDYLAEAKRIWIAALDRKADERVVESEKSAEAREKFHEMYIAELKTARR